MEKIERIDPNNITDKGIIVNIPYTFSIFIFHDTLIDGNSKYDDSLKKDSINLGEHEEEIPNMPITVSFRHLLLQPGIDYLILIDGIPYSLYIVKYYNNAVMKLSKALPDYNKKSSNYEVFKNIIDRKETSESVFLLINNKLKQISGGDIALDLEELYYLFHKNDKGILIKSGYNKVIASLVNYSESDNRTIDFSLYDILMEGFAYDKFAAFYDQEEKDNPKVMH